MKTLGFLAGENLVFHLFLRIEIIPKATSFPLFFFEMML